MIEIFKDIPNFEMYSVSIYGNIRNNKTGQILKPRIRKDGYLQVSVKPNGQKSNKTFRIHREVAEAFIANPDNLPQVNHKDGNKHNNNVNNLEWSSVSYNMKHAYNNNLRQRTRGAKSNLAKLNAVEVFEIMSSTETNQTLANRYGVHNSTISRIRNNKTWN